MKNRIVSLITALVLGLSVQAKANNAVLDLLTLPLRLPFILASHGIVPPVPVVVPNRVVVTTGYAPAPVVHTVVVQPQPCAPAPVYYRGFWYRPGVVVMHDSRPYHHPLVYRAVRHPDFRAEARYERHEHYEDRY
jgi:hypothetical protein